MKIFQLKHFDDEKKQQQTASIISKLIASDSWQLAEKIALFYPMDFEFNLKILFENHVSVGKKILLPKCKEHKKLIFVDARGELKCSKHRIIEPVSDVAENPDLIIVPGLAWNSDNFRVGFGGGYYDRYLANFNGDTISLVYDFQRADFKPSSLDIAIKEVISV